MTQTTDAALVEPTQEDRHAADQMIRGADLSTLNRYEQYVAEAFASHRVASMAAGRQETLAAADTIETQARRIEALEGALRNVRYEAERDNGGLVHLKRAISVATRAALEPTP